MEAVPGLVTPPSVSPGGARRAATGPDPWLPLGCGPGWSTPSVAEDPDRGPFGIAQRVDPGSAASRHLG